MPDITMCLNRQCPLRSKCYRFTAEPNELFQSYAQFEPVNDKKCLSFMELYNKKEGVK